jgi:hypothetical protein
MHYGFKLPSTPSEQFSAIVWQEHITFQWDDNDVHFILDQHA